MVPLVLPLAPTGVASSLDDQGRFSVRELWDRYGADLLAIVALVVAFFIFGLAAGYIDDVLPPLLALWPYPFG